MTLLAEILALAILILLVLVLYDMTRTTRDISSQLKVMNEYANLSLVYRDSALDEGSLSPDPLPTGIYQVNQDDIDEFFVEYESLLKTELRNPYKGVDVRGFQEREARDD